MHPVLFCSFIVAGMFFIVINNHRMPLFQYREIYLQNQGEEQPGAGRRWCRRER